jgi:hypothetical protein
MANISDYIKAAKSGERRPSLSDDHVRIKSDDLKVLDRVTIIRAERIVNPQTPEGEDPVFWQCACSEVPGSFFYASSVLKDKLEEMLKIAGGDLEALNADLDSFGGLPFKMVERTSAKGRHYIAWDPIED